MSNLIALAGSLDDVISKGRNKAYGAFQLRYSHQYHSSSAVAIIVIACSLLLLPFNFRYFSSAQAAHPSAGHANRPLKPQNYILPKIKPVIPPAAQPAVTITPHSSSKTQVVPAANVKPTIKSGLPPEVGKTDPAMTGSHPNTTGANAGTCSVTVPSLDSIKPTAAAALEIFSTAEVMPDFIEGRLALQRYLQKHLRFPAASLSVQVSGRVYVSLVVQADGSIGDITVLKGLGYGTEEAAAHIVRQMPV